MRLMLFLLLLLLAPCYLQAQPVPQSCGKADRFFDDFIGRLNKGAELLEAYLHPDPCGTIRREQRMLDRTIGTQLFARAARASVCSFRYRGIFCSLSAYEFGRAADVTHLRGIIGQKHIRTAVAESYTILRFSFRERSVLVISTAGSSYAQAAPLLDRALQLYGGPQH